MNVSLKVEEKAGQRIERGFPKQDLIDRLNWSWIQLSHLLFKESWAVNSSL